MYTETDLNNVRQAKMDLALGNRIGQVTVRGRTFRYSEVTLAELEKLEATIASSMSKKRTRHQTLSYSKGL